MTSYAKEVKAANPRDVLMTETGFHKWLDCRGGYVQPKYSHHPCTYIDSVREYLGETFGFVKGTDTVDRVALDTLKHIWQNYSVKREVAING